MQVQYIGRAAISFGNEFHIRGMMRGAKKKKIYVNIFQISGKTYYGFGKNKAYPFKNILNKSPESIIF